MIDYGYCKCNLTKIAVCEAHVAHTREQVNDNPCPEIIRRHIQIIDDCIAYCMEYHPNLDIQQIKCEGKPSMEWMFGGRGEGDWRFMEKGCTGNTNSQMECTSMDGDFATNNESSCEKEGRWLNSDAHDCDIGANYWGKWRHLNAEGKVIPGPQGDRMDALARIKLRAKTAKESGYGQAAEDMRQSRVERSRGTFIKPQPSDDVFFFEVSPRKSDENGTGLGELYNSPNIAFSPALPGVPGIHLTTPPLTNSITFKVDPPSDDEAEFPARKRRIKLFAPRSQDYKMGDTDSDAK